MFVFEAVTVTLMRLVIAEVTDGRCEAFALGEVTRRMSISLHAIVLQCKIDHCTKEQRGCERILPCEKNTRHLVPQASAAGVRVSLQGEAFHCFGSSDANAFLTFDCEIPNCRAILDSVTTALNAARTAFI